MIRDVLTPRRLQILELFATHPVMSPREVQKHLGTIYRNVNRELKELAELHYLLRREVFFPNEGGRVSWRYVYGLTRRGAEVVHGRYVGEIRSSSAQHDAEVSATMTVLQAGLGEKLKLMTGGLKRGPVHPDAVFALQNSEGQWFWGMYERERHRQSLSRTNHKGLMDRVERHASYRNTDACEHDWRKFGSYRYFIEVDTSELKDHFLQRLAEKGLLYSWVWVTSTAEIRSGPTGKIWCTPKDFAEARHSLLEI